MGVTWCTNLPFHLHYSYNNINALRFANDGKFKDGIADFEKALTLKCTHRNARNYLVQTQVAYGEK